MGQKSWNLKLHLPDAGIRAAFDYTLSAWNDATRRLCIALLAMRRGDYGDSGRGLWKYLSSATQNWHVLYLVTQPLKEPTSRTGEAEHAAAAPFVTEHGLHRDLIAVRASLPPEMWKQSIEAATARIKSFDELTSRWREDHQKWLEEKAAWEAAHPHYLRHRPMIDTFHEERGVTAGRWGRWVAWLEFLQRPEIVDWRGEGRTLVPLTADELQWAAQNRRRSAERQRELLFKKNPQLKQFHDLHRDYERNYARTGRRANLDGFRHPPTFTLPALPNRPDWPRFQQGQGWKDLDLERRTIRLRLPASEADAAPAWAAVHFVPDPRLMRMRRLPEAVKVGKTSYGYAWHDKAGQRFLAQPGGLKLIQREGRTYVGLTVALHNPDDPLPVTQRQVKDYGSRWTLRKLRAIEPPRPVTTCAVDLAIGHLGAVTVARDGAVVARRILHHRFTVPGADAAKPINVPSLATLDQARRGLGRARRKSGAVREGSRACSRLRDRYRHLRDDRTKKAVAAIFRFARFHGADVIVFEDLQSLRTNAALDRGINRALQMWNRGAIVDMAERLAEDAGLRLVKVGAWWTSRICSRCDALGVRCDQGGRGASRNALRLARLGHWFLCPGCGRRVHADLNASENLHRVFLETFPKTRAAPGGCTVNGRPHTYAEAEAAAAKWLVPAASPR